MKRGGYGALTSPSVGSRKKNEDSRCENVEGMNIDEVSEDTLAYDLEEPLLLSTTCPPSVRQRSSHCFRLVLQWSLLLLVTATVVWTLAYATQAIDGKYYQEFHSEFFKGRSGSNAFTYLGLFYVLIGALCCAAFACGVSLPTPPVRLVHHRRVPLLNEYYSPLEIVCILAFLVAQTVPVWKGISRTMGNERFPATLKWFITSLWFAKPCAWTMSVLFFPVSKNCFWLELVNVKFERALKFHKLMAFVLVVLTVLHGVTAIIYLTETEQFMACMWPNEACRGGLNLSREYTSGWVGTAVAIPLTITSLSWFRRNKYEWFYYTHFLFIPFVILMHLHFNALYMFAPGLAAYILDKVVKFRSTRTPVDLVDLYCPIPGYVRVVLAADPESLTFESGAYLFLNVPRISRLQYHPMSVASAGPTVDDPTVTLDVKVAGDWTYALERLALDRSVKNNQEKEEISVYVDGPHGSSHLKTRGYLDHDAVLMVSGGIGIVPLLSALRTMVRDPESFHKVRKVVFVWVVRDLRTLDLYRDELSVLQRERENADGRRRRTIEVFLYVTQSGRAVAAAAEDEEERTSSSSSSPFKNDRERRRPLTDHTKGHWHNSILTMGAGLGYLLGILVANVAQDEMDEDNYPYLYQPLIQLGCGVTLATIFVFVGAYAPYAVGRLCRARATTTTTTTRLGVHADIAVPAEEAPSPTSSSLPIVEPVDTDSVFMEEHVGPVDDNDKAPLSAVLGCRPNTEALVAEMRESCLVDDGDEKIRSVGVGVCGPDALVRSLANACRRFSDSKLPFVIDMETFDW